MLYTQEFDHALPNKDAALWQDVTAQASDALGRLQDAYAKHPMPYLTMPGATEDLATIQTLANAICERFSHVVLLGTGGSGLGAKALAALTERKQNLPKLHVLENSDMETLECIWESITPEHTLFLLVSKSGNTVEILSHSYVLIDRMKQVVDAERLAEHFRVITQPGHSALRELAEFLGFEILEHHPELGGRYSVMSNVGLLPAACRGVDIAAIRKGANTVLEDMLNAQKAEDSAPVMGAALQAYYTKKQFPIQVFMPYADNLKQLSYWYRQLLSESLGKDGIGITPVTAVGAIDQHSMLQLFLHGPRDKWFTLLLKDQAGTGPEITKIDGINGLKDIMGKHIGDVMEAGQYGTSQALISMEMPLRILRFKTINEELMGALMMHLMLETVLCGDILGVNPFDQPAVEVSKQFAREYLQS